MAIPLENDDDETNVAPCIVVVAHENEPWRHRFSLSHPLFNPTDTFEIEPSDTLALIRRLRQIRGIEKVSEIVLYSFTVSLSSAAPHRAIDRRMAHAVVELMKWGSRSVAVTHTDGQVEILEPAIPKR